MYSDEEVDAAVAEYLATTTTVLRRQGSRDVAAIKDQIYEVIATTFLLHPLSYYAAAWFTSNKLYALIEDQLTDIAAVLEAAPGVSRSTKLVKSTTELVNAEAALANLTAAYQNRNATTARSVGPAVQRFRTATQRFIDTELTKNVVVAQDVTATAEELRTTVAELRLAIEARDLEIRSYCSALEDCDADFAAVRFPDAVMRNLLGRIEIKLAELQVTMASSAAAAASRDAMLQLFVMRNLLLRVSTARAPELVLAPTGTDPTTGTLSGEGEPAMMLCTVSAPYNHGLSTALSVLVAGVASPVVIPGTSRAYLDSKAMSPWVVPGVYVISYAVNGGATLAAATAAYASGAAAATALSAALTGITVTWDASTSTLRFRSTSTADVSSVEFSGDASFLGWAFGAATTQRSEAAEGGTAAEVAEQFNLGYATINASTETTDYGRYTGTSTAGQATVVSSLIEGTLVANGTTTVSDTINFLALGIEPGMQLQLFSPVAGNRSIVAVTASTLELDAAVAASSNTYCIGPDFSDIPAGARVRIGGLELRNRGLYRVVSGSPGRLVLDRSLAVTDVGIELSAFTDFLRLTATGTSTGDTVAPVASAGATAVGLGTTAVPAMTTLDASVDFPSRGIGAGDLLTLTAPGLTTYDVVVEAAALGELEFSPGVAYEAGAWGYVVQRPAAAALATLQTATAAFGEVSYTPTRVALLQVSRGAAFTTPLETVLTTYQTALSTLQSAADAYEVDREPALERALQAMQDQGFDRALDFFLDLRISEFFALSADGVSYSTWLVRTSADAGRQVTPVSRDAPDTTTQWNILSQQSNAFDPE